MSNKGIHPGTPKVSAALEDLWRAARTAEASSSASTALRPCLRPVVDEAHAAGLHAEQLLAMMKESWRSRPVPPGEHRELARKQLDGIITLCIKEFYGER